MKIYNQFNNDKIKEIFKDIYFMSAGEAALRYSLMHDEFIKKYGDGNYRIFSAPGRSEIGGNHTDHNNGRVLACAVSCDIVCFARKRDDLKINMTSYGYDDEFNIDLSNLEVNKNEYDTTISLLRGVAAGLTKNSHEICGFDAYVHSTVLSGSGLSSSAAFEVLMVKVISSLCLYDVDSIERAKISKFAENQYFGKPSGLMDQMACSQGSLISIDFKDIDTPIVEKISYNIGADGYHLVIINTGGSHEDLTSDYSAIPNEMKMVAEYFDKKVLRDVDYFEFIEQIRNLRKVIPDRAILRAKHFFIENERVKRQVEAIKNNDTKSFLDMVIQSGESSYKLLQNIYTTEKEQGLAIALNIAGEILKNDGAWRVHGGGFAGTTLAFVPDDKLLEYVKAMDNVFGKSCASILNIRNSGPIEIKIQRR